MSAYPFEEIEPRWQKYWEEHKTFRTSDEIDPDAEKYYVLDMFPYPSGAGLHVGHPEGYTATDILARYKRMNGVQVLHPIGWDAFGLPAEQYAIETGTHPRETTERNIANFRRQLKALGFSYDWGREVNTTDPDYFKWTQWIFLQLYEKGLAYQADVPVWWCEELGTVLANEEVIDGKSERGSHPCERVPMRQWMLKITDYADRLLEGLDDLDWPESTKEMQRNWIGRSEGAEIDFEVFGHREERLRVFTTRPDTLFGATYMVLAPEHPLVAKVTTAEHVEEVDAYIRAAAQKTDLERTELQKEKTGVQTGGFAINPATKQKIPIWIADYVVAGYGTGAIMAVPGQDQRDWDFAEVYDLPIIRTVEPPADFDGKAYLGDGPAINSDFLNGKHVEEAKSAMIEWLEDQSAGRKKVNYKLRDWLFSRQRYWGEPFPIVFVDGEPRALPKEELPVELPDVDEFRPSGTPEGPLAAVDDWVKTTDPTTGETAVRETNTMPQWAGSCWYYLRYLDPDNDKQLVDPEKERYWMPIDLYIGGSEHAVLHLLYARFWHMVLYDAGVVSTEEPFQRLIHQGLILGEMEFTAYTDEAGSFISAEQIDELDESKLTSRVVDDEQVEKRGDGFVLKKHPEIKVQARAHKMSKSRGNVVNPDDVIAEYGADSLRLYEMFMGPLDQVKPWSTSGVEGVYRFLNRVWRLVMDGAHARELVPAGAEGAESGSGGEPPSEIGLSSAVSDDDPTKDQLRLLHQTIRKVTEDIEGLSFNTAIASMMEFVNAANKWDSVPRAVIEPFVLMLSPFAPHLAEELWRRLGNEESLAYADWPAWKEELLKEDTVELAVQVNGTVRGTVEVDAEADEKSVLREARLESNVARHLEGVEVRREIYVPGRIVNFVVG